jgi:hypothetical protein
MKRGWSGLVSCFLVASAIAAVSSGATGPRPILVAEFAQLRGGVNEVPKGDLDGRGSATVIIPNAGDSGKLCFAILVLGIGKPTAADIHKAPVGKAGPVVVPLRAPANGDPGAVSGCIQADKAVLRDIARNPTRYYVNVHTTDFPAGALRGQLFVDLSAH